ncbi:hypothetical protein B0O99DRAFT_604861 [Bisporella sp. PMI_857]|nr:hypothetical protein B0O99DRAFT_604861 [Bisporella sp. PMI_857]
MSKMNWIRNTLPIAKPNRPPRYSRAPQADKYDTYAITPPSTPPQDNLLGTLPTAHLCHSHSKSLEGKDAAEAVTKKTSDGARYYLTNPQRRGVLGRISFGVRSYKASKAFYTKILAPLDVVPIYDHEILAIVGFGFDQDHEVLKLFEYSKAARPPGPGSSVTFNAPSRRAVREFWMAACRNGGKDEGKPAVLEEFGAFYYAAFILDPDGFRLECVCQEIDGEP